MSKKHWTDKVVLPVAKKPISIRLDEDLLDWFKSQPSNYQTHINAVLRVYMASKKATKSR